MVSKDTAEMKLAEDMPQPLCQISTPMGMLGYGLDEMLLCESLENMNATIPTAIILDSGSTDSGPSKLAMGTMTCPRSSYKRDMTKLIKAALKYRVPLLISSVGGDGSNEHVDEFLDIIKEIVSTLHCPRTLKIVAIYSEISKQVIHERLDAGQIAGCGNAVPELSHAEVDRAPRILAQMGPEPILNAMTANPDFDILVSGRAYDPAPFVAFAAYQKLKHSITALGSINSNVLGGFYHMGKIMECGGVCATPKSRGATAVVYPDGTFDIAPMDPIAKCVPLSVAAHTLYEKTRPDLLHGPGGYLDLTRTSYEQLPDGVTVRVRGGRFEFSVSTGSAYTVKLEGARIVGFRTLFMGSFIDPILIGQIDKYLAITKEYVKRQHSSVEENWRLDFHIYGLPKDSHSSNGYAENLTAEPVFIIGEALADSQDLATSVASTARVHCTHGAYEGQMATSGNFAFGIGGLLELVMGPCSEFSVYHLMDIFPGEESGQPVLKNRCKIVSKDHVKGGLFPWLKTVIEASPTSSNGENGIQYSEATSPVVEKIRKTKPVMNGVKNAGLPEHISTLRDVAKVIRSKNAGPFEVTFDVLFDDVAVYNAVKLSGLLSPETVTKLFNRDIDDIVWCGFFDQALAFKVTLPRRRGGELACSGGYLETDVHGSQQYMPLMKLKLDKDLIQTLKALT